MIKNTFIILVIVLLASPLIAHNKDNDEPMDRIVERPEGASYLGREGENEGYIVYFVPMEGFTLELTLDEDDWEAEKVKDLTLGLRSMRRQLRDVKAAIPAHAWVKLQNLVVIEYEDRENVSPTYYPAGPDYPPAIELWGIKFHRDILDGNYVENYVPESDEYGNPNIMLHELAHAWHDNFIEDGFDNQEIIDMYERALESYETENENDQSYYWTTNHKEWFAEFSVMFFRHSWDSPHHYWNYDYADKAFFNRMWGREFNTEDHEQTQ